MYFSRRPQLIAVPQQLLHLQVTLILLKVKRSCFLNSKKRKSQNDRN